ncbi:MAG: dTDP-glucose 4,6-dehydratase [Acidobacteriota bacterium]
MKLLVTGGAGFIGSNFIRYILGAREDIQVVALDCLTYAGNLMNLSDVSTDPRYSFFKGDIRSHEDVESCLSQGIDVVINFAAESHVDRSILDGSAFVRTNVEGVQVLLEACRQGKVPRFVQVSTDEVYGSLGDRGRFTEDSPYAPNSPYAATKASADLLARAYHKTHGMDIRVTRCCNNYGSYQFPEKLIPLMVLNALEGKPLPVYGDGLNARDWIHVEDHCRALECVMMEGEAGRIYNIGSDQEERNLDVIHAILDILGVSRDLIQFVTDRPGHDRRYAIDATLLRREFGWEPKISFEKGLADTVQWYTRNKEWVEGVRSGSYLSYYQQMYEDREQTLNRL